MYKIGIDAMGLNKGLNPVIDAITYFAEDYSDVEFVVFGRKSQLSSIEHIAKIIDCLETVDPKDDIENVIKNKDISLVKAMEYLNDGKIDALVSGANSYAFLKSSLQLLELFEEIKTPALATFLPKAIENEKICLLDCGFSEDTSPERLYMLSRMGKVLAQVEKSLATPSIRLLKTRFDNFKYNKNLIKAEKLIEEKEVQGFKGLIEPRYMLTLDTCDVVVCGGSEGDLLLSTIEATTKSFVSSLKKSFDQSFSSRLGYFIAKSSLEPLKNNVDYKNYAASLLVGFTSVVVKTPQDGDVVSFYNAIKFAYNMSRKKIMNKMRSEFF